MGFAQEVATPTSGPGAQEERFQHALTATLDSLADAASKAGETNPNWREVTIKAMRLAGKRLRTEARDTMSASWALTPIHAENGYDAERAAVVRALEKLGLRHHRTFFNRSGFVATSGIFVDGKGKSSFYQISALVVEPEGCYGGRSRDDKGYYCTIYVAAARVLNSRWEKGACVDKVCAALEKAVVEVLRK